MDTNKFELPPEAVAIFKDLVTTIIEHAKECDPVELLDPEQEKFYQAKIVVGLDEKQMDVVYEMKSRFNYYSPNPEHYRYSK